MSLLDSAGVMSTDIWCTGAFAFESPLKELLDSGKYTLEQLLAEDELLQELRGVHPHLIDYFSQPEAVADLVRYVILAPQNTPPRSIEEAMGLTSIAPDANTDDGDGNQETGQPQQAQVDASAADAENHHADGDRDVDVDNTNDGQPQNEIQGSNDNNVNNENGNGNYVSDQEKNEMLYIRFPYMACEVICCEIQGVVDVIVDGAIPTAGSSPNGQADDQQPRPDGDENTEADAKADTAAEANANAETNTDAAATATASDEAQADDTQAKDTTDTAATTTPPTTTTTEAENEASAEPHAILDLLFSVLYDSEPGEIDDYRAGYFDKILSVLFRKRPQAMSHYLNTGGGRGSEALMNAMFKHLYSHSIMQIVQRLLLPQPPMLPNPEVDEQDENKDGDELYNDTMEQQMDMDGFRTFRCDWSDSPVALKSLLDCLVTPPPKPASTDAERDQIGEERHLSLCQNASEVLITIIQNSPLTSPMLHTLTTDPILDQLMITASKLDTEEAAFSPHDSSLTCTMNVLESLILQLGGYGSVGTVILPEVDENGEPIDSAEAEAYALSQNQRLDLATSETLRKHLPKMLDSLSQLLLHKSADSWMSPMQYSKNRAQPLLGSSRLRIVRLLESLVLLGDADVDSVLCRSRCLEICLDLFWKFQWCSMLHQSVANLLVHVFEGANARAELQEYFIVQCNLLGRLMDSFASPETDGSPPEDGAIGDLSAALFNLKRQNSAPSSSVDGERGSSMNDDDEEDHTGDADMEDSEQQSKADDGDNDVAGTDTKRSGDSETNEGADDQAGETAASADAENANIDDAENGDDDASNGNRSSDDNTNAEDAIQSNQDSTEDVGGAETAATDMTTDPNEEGVLAQPQALGAEFSSEQSFRLGYMGHVIIICQALVHACSCEGEMPEGYDDLEAGMYPPNQGDPGPPQMNGDVSSIPMEGAAPSVQPDADGDKTEGAQPGQNDPENPGLENPAMDLVLVQLVETHPLAIYWQDFISTTLANETAIQSTPLGGMNLLGGPMDAMDALQPQRPGLADDGDYDDDGSAPPMPPRGIMADGDVIDMDDNDLDMAANMMMGMQLGGNAGADADARNAELLAGIAPQDESGQQPSNYVFDDPLGSGRFAAFDGDAGSGDQRADANDGGDDSSSSSDGEPEQSGSTQNTSDAIGAVLDGESTGANEFGAACEDVPVLDLFAGNMQITNNSTDGDGAQQEWANFANFDNAFESSTPEPEEDPASDTLSPSGPDEGDDEPEQPKMTHSFLLDEDGGGNGAAIGSDGAPFVEAAAEADTSQNLTDDAVAANVPAASPAE